MCERWTFHPIGKPTAFEFAPLVCGGTRRITIVTRDVEHFSHPGASVPAAYGPYSHSIIAGDFVFLAGQTARDTASGKVIDGDITAQTTRCLQIVRDILQQHGLDLHDVVRTTVFLAHIEDFDAMNKVYGAMFDAPYPVRSAVEVRMPYGALIGIEVTAFRG